MKRLLNSVLFCRPQFSVVVYVGGILEHSSVVVVVVVTSLCCCPPPFPPIHPLPSQGCLLPALTRGRRQGGAFLVCLLVLPFFLLPRPIPIFSDPLPPPATRPHTHTPIPPSTPAAKLVNPLSKQTTLPIALSHSSSPVDNVNKAIPPNIARIPTGLRAL
ncbi:hypothetical protein EX30DRAFT_59967 [Ascodesmis nigricans]|uniref:Uncharacterized protein n=1 Tax=Ascodesmis nigricans TaxID=341454 RepID=A0A4V3SIJ9_9PEZI|nr:hypothetical protein EX30DRAFT_59967 [Ascodesmis nigricans]